MIFNNLYDYNYPIEAGCDEVGRSCLAGPVIAAAVILPVKFAHVSLKDSKKLTTKQRLFWNAVIREQAMDWAIGCATPEEIDQFNISNATHLAMHRAIDKLVLKPHILLIDGKYFNGHPTIKHLCVTKGDELINSIAAASIIAKVYHDQYMRELAKQEPGYNWEVNIGYPTPCHRQAILDLGITTYHRKTFRCASVEGRRNTLW
ncbi:MAG: ribonuclease HII [Candidatus Amoebophilus sp.]